MCSKIQCNMQNGNAFLYLNLHLPIPYVQHLVQNENSIISFKFAIFYTSFNMHIKNIF